MTTIKFVAQPLSYPAPRRCSVSTSIGKYYTIPWTAEDVKFARSGGAFFQDGRHDFANVEARKAAGLKGYTPAAPAPEPVSPANCMSVAISKMQPDQKAALVRILSHE